MKNNLLDLLRKHQNSNETNSQRFSELSSNFIFEQEHEIEELKKKEQK